MMYCGIFISKWYIDITVLSGEYAYLGSKKFRHDEFDSIEPWIDSFKVLLNEKCVLIFNEDADNKNFRNLYPLISIKGYNDINFVPYRKIINILIFLHQCCLDNNNIAQIDFTPSFILASSFRLFDVNEIKPSFLKQ